MLPDDVFRDRLEQTLVELEAWAKAASDSAEIDIGASRQYWRMSAIPHARGACPLELMIKSDQTFSLKLAGEVYEDRPADKFDFFLKLSHAIAAGRVERIETLNALTVVLLVIAMRVELAPQWEWIGERRLAIPAADGAEERRTHRFLPYRRHSV
jgi:hypothetical protein